jgi:hypothetical protein
VGIQTAAEANGNWEFRFADKPLNVLTLLAQDSDRYLHDYVLPPKLVQQHWKQFERVNGDVVVRLKKVAKGDVVLESSDGEIAVQQFEGDYDELQ